MTATSFEWIQNELEHTLVYKPNTDFGYNPKIPSTQRLLVSSIPIEGALHEYG